MVFLRNWRIWRKLLIVLGLIAVLCVSLVAVGAYNFNRLATITEDLVTHTTASLRLARSARLHMATLHQLAFERNASAGNSSVPAIVEQKSQSERAELASDLVALRGVIEPVDVMSLDGAFSAAAEYDQVMTRVRTSLRNGNREMAEASLLSAGSAASDKVNASLDHIIARHLRELAASNAIAQNAASNATWRMIAVSGLGLLLVFGLALHIVRREITLPLESVTRAISGLARGDIEATVSGPERGDEVGDLTRAFVAFQQDKASYRSLTANVPGIVYQRVRRQDGTIEYPFMSDGIREMLGLDPAAVLAQPALMLAAMHQNDCERYRAAIKASADSLGPLDIEFRHIRTDGEVRWIHVVSRPRLGDKGSIIWDCLGFDTTEHHKMTSALRENEERIRGIAENLPGFLFQCFVSSRGILRFKLISTPKFDFRGVHAEDLAEGEHAMFDFVHPDDRQKLTNSIFAARESGSDWNETIRILIPHGPERWVHITALLRGAASGETVWEGIALDETDRIATAEKNAQLLVKLRQAEKLEAIGTLTGGVAHELNNLLQPIIMMTELVLTELPEGSRHAAQLLRVIDAGGKAAEIVRRILAFGRADEASHDPLDIGAVLREAYAFIRTILPSSITLHIDMAEDVGTVRGDKTQLTQVLINMATNARDAIGANVGTVWVSLSRLNVQDRRPMTRVSTIHAGRYAVITVRDTGTGMDEATVRRIFEPFFTTKGVGKGTGLGLSVTHGIITGHGGAMQVDSAPGRGAIFSIYLPLEENSAVLALAG